MFNFSPATLLTTYKGNTGYRALSPRIWSRVAAAVAMTPDGSDSAYLVGSDFRAFGKTAAVSSNVGRYNDGNSQYITYEDNSCTLAQIETNRNGAIVFTTSGTDEDELSMNCGDTKSVNSIISSTAADNKLLAFECRFKIGTLAETAVFIGLTEEGTAITNALVDSTGAVADKDRIGFHIPSEYSVATCNFVWKKAGQTAVTLISGLKTMVADTYYNMGFVYDPNADASKRLTVYLDNAEQSTYGTNTQLTAATFPDGEELIPHWAIKATSASARTLTLDSWALAQVG